MIVIADTTPLISLMKIGRLGLLKELFGMVYIPKQKKFNKYKQKK